VAAVLEVLVVGAQQAAELGVVYRAVLGVRGCGCGCESVLVCRCLCFGVDVSV
jgi:hypothetical protein